MKQQQFRFRLIALFLIALLGAALLGGLRTISFTGPSGDLRSAILRLTGQETASPSPGVSVPPAASVSPDAEASPGAAGSPAVSPAPSSGPELSTLGLGEIWPAASPTSSLLPLSEALSGYFSAAESPAPSDSAGTGSSPEPPAAP